MSSSTTAKQGKGGDPSSFKEKQSPLTKHVEGITPIGQSHSGCDDITTIDLEKQEDQPPVQSVEKPRIQKARKSFPSAAATRHIKPPNVEREVESSEGGSTCNGKTAEKSKEFTEMSSQNPNSMHETYSSQNNEVCIEITHRMNDVVDLTQTESNSSKDSENTSLIVFNNDQSPLINPLASPKSGHIVNKCLPSPKYISAEQKTLTPPKLEQATTEKSSPRSLNGEKEKSSLLASMKRAYETELDRNARTLLSSESESTTEDGKSPSIKGKKSIEIPALMKIDEYEQAKRSSISSSDSPPKLLNKLKEEIETSAQVLMDVAKIPAVNQIPPEDRNKASANEKTSIVDVHDVFHPPTPAPTPQADDLANVEAAMAALHGESLDSIEEMQINSSNGEASMTSDYSVTQDQSDSDQTTPPRRETQNRKMGPKSKTMDKPPENKKPSTSKRPRTSAQARELARLYMDEGALNIMREMKERGENKRRTVIQSEAKKREEAKRSPSEKVSREEYRVPSARDGSQKATRGRKRKIGESARTSAAQDNAIKQWEALRSPSAGEEVVFVPRKMVNAADASKIIRRRSFSSDSSLDNTKNKDNSDLSFPNPTDSTPRSQPSYLALEDHAYTIVKRTEEKLLSERDAEILTAKLGSNCKEFYLRCTDNLLHVTLSSFSSSVPNSLNNDLLRELITLLKNLKSEPRIYVVLFTSAGNDFCRGIDYSSLVHDNQNDRFSAALNTATLIQEFITELANCDKILIGGLTGSVVGLGVAMLPYLDLVYASDKSTFFLPYSLLAQTTEGGLSLTVTSNSSVSRSLFSLMVYEGRRLTASEAQNMGLVDDILWPSSFLENLIPRVRTMANNFSLNTLQTKKMIRASLRRDLPNVLKEETTRLRESWISDEFQRRARSMIASGDLLA